MRVHRRSRPRCQHGRHPRAQASDVQVLHATGVARDHLSAAAPARCARCQARRARIAEAREQVRGARGGGAASHLLGKPSTPPPLFIMPCARQAALTLQVHEQDPPRH